MAKQKMGRTGLASNTSAKDWNGKGTWERIESRSAFHSNHDAINWNDGSTGNTIEVIKTDGKTIYKVKS